MGSSGLTMTICKANLLKSGWKHIKMDGPSTHPAPEHLWPVSKKRLMIDEAFYCIKLNSNSIREDKLSKDPDKRLNQEMTVTKVFTQQSSPPFWWQWPRMRTWSCFHQLWLSGDWNSCPEHLFWGQIWWMVLRKEIKHAHQICVSWD